jgi:hypothetical protein
MALLSKRKACMRYHLDHNFTYFDAIPSCYVQRGCSRFFSPRSRLATFWDWHICSVARPHEGTIKFFVRRLTSEELCFLWNESNIRAWRKQIIVNCCVWTRRPKHRGFETFNMCLPHPNPSRDEQHCWWMAEVNNCCWSYNNGASNIAELWEALRLTTHT